MSKIFVNLKRFDVPKKSGGLCPIEDPLVWIESVIDKSVELGLGMHHDLHMIYLLPEGLVPTAIQQLAAHPQDKARMLEIGCQGVHWHNVTLGGNFGAFTTSLPAAAASALGCAWAIIGHSEERRDKLQIIQAYDQAVGSDVEARTRAARAIDALVNAEVQCALDAGINVLLCVGETAEERGEGGFEDQKPRIEQSLKNQLLVGLKGAKDKLSGRDIIIGYEPIWAIGPGKVPPDAEYIGFVSALIMRIVQETHDFDPVVVYGGGLKEENAAMLASIDTIGGGLVALTRFTGDIGFDVQGLHNIVGNYLG